MLTRTALGLAALLLAACAQRPDVTRGLPGDHTAPLLYVALGDSTVEGVGASRPELNYVSRLTARLRERYPAAQAANLGVGGATSADVMADQLTRAVELSPHLVTLSIGPNDITEGVPVRKYERNVATILKALSQKTAAVVVVNLLPDLGTTRRFRGGPHEDKVRRLTIQFNEALAAAARTHGVEVVDLYTPSREEVPRHPELLAADGYHPSDAGYARWAELMWRGIERRMIRDG
ncbi:MAG: SGNH/GDSL hydrolase family protein [Candidatus Rokuibacteriota bacterium]